MQLSLTLQAVLCQQLLPRADKKGRVAAIEVMISNSAIRNHIREAKTFQIPSVLQMSRKAGMITMDDAIYELYTAGKIDRETALLFSQDRAAVSKRLGF